MEDGVEISNLSIPIAKGDKGDAGKISSLIITMLESNAMPTVINNGTVYDARYILGIPRGKSIVSTNINVNGELVITFDDETTITVGEVVGTSVANMYVDENSDLIVELTDSTELIVGNLSTILAPALEDYYNKATIDNTFSLITETGNKIDLTINSSTYVMTLNLRDKNNNILSTGTVDLPLESVVVNGRYDSATKKLILTLQNGNTIEINIGDLVNGLQAEITANNKLSADLVDDTNATNKFVTSAEKTKIGNAITSTNYASRVTGGTIMVRTEYNLYIRGGVLSCEVNDYTTYLEKLDSAFISKGTLENVLNARIGDISTALDLINGEVI